MKNVYLFLSLAGAVVPYGFFMEFFGEFGIDLPVFVSALFANGAVGGFTADLLISSLVFWIFMVGQKDGPAPWLFILLNLAVGLSCALPAYLYATSRRDGGHSVAA